VAFSEIEYAKLKLEAYNAGVSVAELIRAAALRREITPPPPPIKLSDNFQSQLREIGTQLNLIAKKVNRAAKAGNALKLDADQVQTLWVKLRSVLGMIQNELDQQRSPQVFPMEPHRHNNSKPKVHGRSIRFAPDEHELLKQKAHQARTSVTRFIRQAALKLEVVEPPPPSECCSIVHAELSDINNNFSQLSRAVNLAIDEGQQLSFPQELVEQILSHIHGTGLQLLDATDQEVD